MKQFIDFPLEDGGSIVVEAEVLEPEGVRRSGRDEDTIIKAGRTLETALDRVKPAAEAILKRLTDLSQRPDEIEVEFGIKVTAEAGAIIASGSVEANYTVKLKWARESPKDNPR